jgi:HAD superfamily hydrolase (TIGR01450 family)
MKDYFGKDTAVLKEKKLFLFDMDGTIYLGNRLFDGVKELLAKIKSDGGRYVFITNNSSRSVKDYVKKLQNMGIEVDEDNFFTSTQAAVLIFREKFGQELIYAQGTKSFVKELKKNGLRVTTKYTHEAKAILVGYDTELTSKK